ncbi:zinc finger protein on ecdysone puffs-like [Nilaparvata lugens]|uniref:zinc finger protein on ecdysone puffs-like n=1 Tax=Nilaparvata lugens TaxID=108931 RepID=UPI00193D5957|nr:zinc finger protein on ecdysone puffs-like [Nilaparvata lugens]
MAAMQKLTIALRSKLSIMRIEQRREQRIIDEQRSSRNLNTIFCAICKLNFRCLASAHARSFRHQKMKKFLMPMCRVCGITAKSPMQYEHHICEVNHLKRAAKKDKEREVDKDNYMVVDAVGSQDEESDKEGKEKSKTENKDKTEEGQKEGDKSPEKKKKNLEVEYGE